MPTENSVITREHLPGLLLARTIWENGGPSLYFPPALQDATDQARAALPAPVSVPDGYMPIPKAEQLADALENVRCFHDMSAELIAPELLANLLAAPTVKESLSVSPSMPAAGSTELPEPDFALDGGSQPCYYAETVQRIGAALSAQQSAQQSAPPEFCCELSYKAAKQKAWNARRIDRCKCDHNEYCDHCWPADFRPGGKWHGKFVAQQSAHVSVPRELLEDLRDCANECYNHARLRGTSGLDNYERLTEEADAIINGGEA